MQLTPNFSLAELVHSDTAHHHGICNDPSEDVVTELRQTAELLEKIRDLLGCKPIHVTSGYRCVALNQRIGGVAESAHCAGRAVDFTCPAFGTPLAICRQLLPFLGSLDIDQLIHEHGAWVHVGRAPVARFMALTIDARGTRRGFA